MNETSQKTRPVVAGRVLGQLQALAANPLHAILIVGGDAQNSGEVSSFAGELIAKANNLSQRSIYDIDKYPLNIEDIRNLRVIASQRGSKNGTIQTIVILRHADSLSIEAQNALLKSLEEPSVGLVYILGANTKSSLLSTIRSRVHEITLGLPSVEDFRAAFKNTETDQLDAAYRASNGSVVRFNAYINGDTATLDLAKNIISEPLHARLMRSAAIGEDREQAISVIESLQSVLRFLLHRAVKSEDQPATIKLTTSLELAHKTKQAIRANANSKIELDRLFVNL